MHSARESGWWRSAVIYQVYLRSFADGNGDGTGDIVGLRSRLAYIRSLGVDGVWINPWYVSPLNDGGYDVADYRNIDPLFGTLEDARALFAEAHAIGLRVLIDIVPNHTSSEHEWFQAALASPKGSSDRARYHFVEGRGADGEDPPNNWSSVFGGPAWTSVGDGQWYLHLFDSTQPDLNWTNPEVREEFDSVLRFWLDLGADGIRVDVAHGLAKEPRYADMPGEGDSVLGGWGRDGHPHWDREDVHEIVRGWRSVLDEYEGTVMVAEAWVENWERLARYLRPGEFHQVFDFQFLETDWAAKSMRDAIEVSLEGAASVDALPTWVLSNHDVVRHPTRYGLETGTDPRAWLLDGDRAALDAEAGHRRARAAFVMMSALPGSMYLYQGEELGLPEAHDLDASVLDDPVFERSGRTLKGRDGCRVPFPWSAFGDSMGFGDNGAWLPQPESYRDLAADVQDGVEGSSLELYRRVLALRKQVLADGAGFEWHDLGVDTLGFVRDGAVLCAVNFSDQPLPLPGGDVLVSSDPLDGGLLPQDTAAWIAIG